MEFAIVVVGYNRPDCLFRLLTSVNRADYSGDEVPLIISIDNSGNDNVIRIAKKFNWDYGEKIIKTFPERKGLREHILACGDFTTQYKNIIVFEDDLYVSESFYQFAKQTVKFYENDDRIAGIALYSHFWHIGCNRPFLPINDKFDGYFLQYACSWGQVWSKDKWNQFVGWYEKNKGEFAYSPNIPENVLNWPGDSWLKYHIKYCIETDKFFFYPRKPLSTNFSSKGQHHFKNNTGYQVPLLVGPSLDYKLPHFDESFAKYDAFFEFLKMGECLKFDNNDICVDLYGLKRNILNKKYWITMEIADYKEIESFDLSMRPHEMNVINHINGDIIHLYDTEIKSINKKRDSLSLQKLIIEYDIKNISYYRILKYILITTIEKTKGRILRFYHNFIKIFNIK